MMKEKKEAPKVMCRVDECPDMSPMVLMVWTHYKDQGNIHYYRCGTCGALYSHGRRKNGSIRLDLIEALPESMIR